MLFRTRHQQEAIDAVILDASGWKDARNSSLFCENTRLCYCGLSRRMDLGEPAAQLRFAVWLWPAHSEPCKIFEDVPNQCRVSGEDLVKGKRRNALGILRERKF